MKFTTSLRDFKSIQWGATFQLNLMRSVAAGVVWMVLTLFLRPSEMPIGTVFLLPIMFPVWWIFGGTLGLVAAKIVTVFAGELGALAAHIFFFLFGLGLAFGDPLIHILSEKKPEWVPVEEFPYFKPALWIFVRKPGWQPPAER